LEITEAVLIGDDEAALNTFAQLRELGVHIALDDFGTGYSSLRYLHRFPFNKIKIDRAFVGEVAEGTGSAVIKAVVGIAADRAMITTAEGVGTRRQFENGEVARLRPDSGLSVQRCTSGTGDQGDAAVNAA
jgi:EAL domain-containing protein (putative c-di-GMP-specific phosphodiesterase class I)